MENQFFIDAESLSESALAKKHQLENDPSSRKDHMEYLPGMEVIESDKNAGYRQAERPIIFGIDGLTDALEAVEHGTMQGTVYNDKEDQARMIALLTVALFQGSDIEGYGLEDDIYYMSQYRKVDADNVDTFLGK